MVEYTKNIYHKNIEKDALKNKNYRKVVYTVPGSIQLVLMNLKPTEFIPKEIHEISQFVRIESGTGEVIIDYDDGAKTYKLEDGVAVIIPPGVYHKIINTGKEDLKLYAIYEKQEHISDLIE